MMNGRSWFRSNGRYDGSLAALFIVQCCGFWILGNSFGSVALAANIDRITGPEAVERMRQVLGDPQIFEDNMKNSTQDFIEDHFGSMAIATAFAIAIRMKT
jgi:hypothetical protein